MNPSGIVRRIDDLGRIVIPKEIRRMLEIKNGDPLEIFYSKGEICLRKYEIVMDGEDGERPKKVVYYNGFTGETVCEGDEMDAKLDDIANELYNDEEIRREFLLSYIPGDEFGNIIFDEDNVLRNGWVNKFEEYCRTKAEVRFRATFRPIYN